MLKRLLLFIILIAALIFPSHLGVKANSLITWLAPSPLVLDKQSVVTALPSSINGNIDCIQTDSVACVVNTPLGGIDQNSSINLNGTKKFVPLISYIDSQPRSIAIPNSATIINYTTEPSYGLNLYFTKDAYAAIKPVDNYGSLEYHLNRNPDSKLVDKSGKRLAADTESMSFSADGRWMILSEPNVAMLRVNLETFEVLPFAPGFDYTIGLGPLIKTAITNDGRYAVVASGTFATAKVYDLSTCGPIPNTINGPVTCQSRSIQEFLGQQISGFRSINNLRFISDDTLSLYARYSTSSGNQLAKYLLNGNGTPFHGVDLLALGDSYISGEGAYNYLPGTDTSDNHCHVSMSSYPYLVSSHLDLNSFHSLACSGAKTPDITNTNTTYSGQTQLKVQRDRRSPLEISTYLNNFLPGYIDQLDFVSIYQPKKVLISVGGNDIGFSNVLKRCLEPDTCYSTYEDRVELVREINSKFPDLASTYQQVKNATAPDSGVYVVGYPQIANPDGNCADNVHLSKQELDFSDQLISYLNQVIKQAAGKAGVVYLDTENALNGFRLCETNSWSTAVNGLTAGNDAPSFLSGPIGIESYHLNSFGHQLMQNKILEKSQSLSISMPSPILINAPPPEAGQSILNAPHTGRVISWTNYDESLGNDVAHRDGLWSLTVSGMSHSLKALSPLHAVLNSSPVDLGTYVTDSTGNLSVNITLPHNVESGFHTIHLYGTNMANEPIDIYKTIFVAASTADFDGDGIINSLDACIAVTPSGQDYDQDGVDDSCDGFVAQKPAPASLPPSTPTQQSGISETQANPLEISSILSPSSGGLMPISHPPTPKAITFTPGQVLDQPQMTPATNPLSAIFEPRGKVLSDSTYGPPQKANSSIRKVIMALTLCSIVGGWAVWRAWPKGEL